MLAPISWLRDYVDIKVSPEKLAEKLVAIGFEVESIERQSERAKGVVTARILSVEKHPAADRLRVAQVDIGKKTIQVVTNVAVEGGEYVAVALDGAVLANGQSIKRGELRGVLSEGMLCGVEELGVPADLVEGHKEGEIVCFPEGTATGVNALVALGFDDVVLDVGVTANRPDCNSIWKLAKEVAVALGTTCREPEISYKATGADVKGMVAVEVRNPELCPRYMAAGVRNVRIFPSSAKIRKRLTAVGIRPINNIVDITNYVLVEIGQPMHAFDLRHLGGGRIVVRTADEGEKIVSLDGKLNTLTTSMLAICDSTKPVAVAGIMGGENSGIMPDTTDIVFESARFARDSIRRTSRALNLRSASSARFEKGMDFACQQYGLDRALTLIYESGSGEIAKGVIDVKVDYPKEKKIVFTTARLARILGCAVPRKRLISILARLGIPVTVEGRVLTAHIPDERSDIEGVNDIAEEFIRVYGYSHVKPTLFAHSTLTKGGVPAKILFRNKVKERLVGLGYCECITYSFTSPQFKEKLRLPADSTLRRTVDLVNPLGEALSVMRTILTPSMIETLSFNASHFNKSAALFETAKTYHPKSLPLTELPEEKEKLVIGAYGDGADFFTLKGAVEELAECLHIDASYAPSDKAFLHPGRGANVYADGREVGFLGEIHPDVAAAYDCEERLYVAELDLDALFAVAKEGCRFREFSKYPPAERDLAVVVGEEVPAGALLDAAKNAGAKDLVSAEVFDVYRGAQVGAGKKSVALGFAFSSTEHTLTDEEIADSMTAILSALENEFGAEIRS